MLTGHEIFRQWKKRNICIDPFDVKQLNPNSYNVRLDNRLKVYDKHYILDMKGSNTCYDVL